MVLKFLKKYYLFVINGCNSNINLQSHVLSFFRKNCAKFLLHEHFLLKMTSQTQKFPVIAISITLIFSITALLFSYLAQYTWDMEPCRLCKLQRLPYCFAILFSGLAFLPSFRKIAVRLTQLSLLMGMGLAGYHLMVIGGIVSDPCSVPKGIASIEDFRRMLNAPLPCSKITGKLLGIPLAGYNAIISFILFFILQR